MNKLEAAVVDLKQKRDNAQTKEQFDKYHTCIEIIEMHLKETRKAYSTIKKKK